MEQHTHIQLARELIEREAWNEFPEVFAELHVQDIASALEGLPIRANSTGFQTNP